jgi:hypothetical protein
MSDQEGHKNRVRRILPPEPEPPATQVQPRVGGRQERLAPPVTRGANARTTQQPRSEIYQYIVGGLVSATVLLLLIVIWLIATGGNHVGNPAPGGNTSLGAGDVPTIQLPLSSGTLVPGEVPTSNLVVPPAQPSFGPK